MFTFDISCSQILQTLCERESLWQSNRFDSMCKHKVAIFTAGPTAREFYRTLYSEYGIEAEFFIDNNRELAGTTVCGKPVLFKPWKTMPRFADEYAVIVASSYKNYREISAQLEDAGITEHMCWYAFLCSKLWPRYAAICSALDDEASKCSYLSVIYSMLTDDVQFIQYGGEQYFGHQQFVNPWGQTIVDAGAFVGDSLVRYVTRGFGNVTVYAFEPFEKCLPAINARKKRLCEEWLLDDDRIVIIPAGLGNTTIGATFTGVDMLRQDDSGNTGIPIYKLDNFFEDKAHPTIIKADIEGMELDMLRGAEGILREHKPKLAVSIYHTPQDMATIAEYVIFLDVGYKLAVRNHCDHFEDTILYCWV